MAAEEPGDVTGLNCLEEEPGARSSGAEIKVYLRGDDIRYVDWTSERGSQVIRRQYYFQRRNLVLVVETIHAKWDRHLGELKHPRLVSTNKFNVEDESSARRSEFLQQAKQLLADFRERRAAYRPCGASRD